MPERIQLESKTKSLTAKIRSRLGTKKMRAKNKRWIIIIFNPFYSFTLRVSLKNLYLWIFWFSNLLLPKTISLSPLHLDFKTFRAVGISNVFPLTFSESHDECVEHLCRGGVRPVALGEPCNGHPPHSLHFHHLRCLPLVRPSRGVSHWEAIAGGANGEKCPCCRCRLTSGALAGEGIRRIWYPT